MDQEEFEIGRPQVKINPFASPYPVNYPEELYGRTSVVKKVIRGLFMALQPISQEVVGATRIGKTSVFNALASLNDSNHRAWSQQYNVDSGRLQDTLFVQVDCSTVLGDPATFWSLMGEQVAQAVAMQMPDLRPALKGSESLTFKEFKGDLAPIIRERVMIVFLLDRFDRVAARLPIEVSFNLRSLIGPDGRIPRNIAFVTASRRPLADVYMTREDNVLGDMVSPFLNVFSPEPIYLGLLDEYPEGTSVRRFITEPSAQHGILFNQEDIKFATEEGGGHPDLTRLASSHLFDIRDESPKTSIDYVAVHRALVSQFELPFQSIMSDLDDSGRLAVEHLATTGSIPHDIPYYAIKWLVQIGMIQEQGSRFSFCSPVIAELARNSVTEAVRSTIWPAQRALQLGSQIHIFSPNEWKIFWYLFARAGQLCTRDELLELLHSDDLDITISRVRQKLDFGSAESPISIITVRGQGYRLQQTNRSIVAD